MENDENVDPTAVDCMQFDDEDVYTSAEVVAKFRQVRCDQIIRQLNYLFRSGRTK
jgi:hypothetical protein